jgi:hypothetical protein
MRADFFPAPARKCDLQIPVLYVLDNPDDLTGAVPFFKFHRLGVRVPALLISAWIKKWTVVDRPPNGPTPASEYEHSSIRATINVRSGFLSKRDEWTGTFKHIFTQLGVDPGLSDSQLLLISHSCCQF